MQKSDQTIFRKASKITIHGGRISRKNYGRMLSNRSTSDMMYQVGTCSKVITAVVVACLYERGLLDYELFRVSLGALKITGASWTDITI
jgi:CubicO group peptidase (beta-lactamase class C family)